MAFLAQVTTLVYTAVLAPDSGLTPDLSRLAFGALLWIVLVILNRGTAGASPETLRPRGRSRAELRAAGDTPSRGRHLMAAGLAPLGEGARTG